MKSTRVLMTLGAVLATALTLDATASPANRSRFTADLQTTSRFVPLQAIDPDRCVDEPGHAPVVGLLDVVGAGRASMLGPVVDEQSHCLRADFSFFAGRFTLIDARKQSISGRYFGRLEPTFNATFPADAPPGGQWLVLGNVCIERASAGRIEDDCEQRRYQPARGITNLTSGDATIFLDRTIGIRDRE